MSTRNQNNFIINVSGEFGSKILKSYAEIRDRYLKAYYDSSWDSSGLSAGKFCEIMLRFLQKELTGSCVPFDKKIGNFSDECTKLMKLPAEKGVESLRIIIPRALVFVYTIRSKRSIGHTGGDVDSNEMDASIIYQTSSWILCELIRIYHSLSTEEAAEYISGIMERKIPDVWEIENKKRVLRSDLNYKQKTLLLMYTDLGFGVLLEDLFEWVEYSNLTYFKQDIVKKLHKEKFIEFNEPDGIVYISPLGKKEVEEKLLSNCKTNIKRKMSK
jgi:hypothetical protein